MSIWSAIGSVAGSLIGAGSSSVGAGLSYKNQKKLAKYNADLNYQYAEKSALNQPTWNRVGLEQAGYNPMLAVQNSTSGANSSWTSAQSANAPDIAGGISSGLANAQSFQRLKNETDVALSTEDMNYANADKAKAEANESVLRSRYIPDKEKSIIAKQNAEAKKLENDIHIAEEGLKLQEKLGLMGLDVQKRGQDKVYNASTYSTRTGELNEIRRLNSSEYNFGLGKFYRFTKRSSNWK